MHEVPSDFRCPITHEIMSDPVIIPSTGHTYDRSSILKWFSRGRLSCPKSGTEIYSPNLVPNYALKSVISQWLEGQFYLDVGSNHNLIISHGFVPCKRTKLTSSILLGKLRSEDPESIKDVLGELIILSNHDREDLMGLGEMDAIPLLLKFLDSEDREIQKLALVILFNLSRAQRNLNLMASYGDLTPILRLLLSGADLDLKEVAALVVCSLLRNDISTRVKIGKQIAAIQGLMGILSGGTVRGKRIAILCLQCLSQCAENLPKLIEAGTVSVLEALVRKEDDPTVYVCAKKVLVTIENGRGMLHWAMKKLCNTMESAITWLFC